MATTQVQIKFLQQPVNNDTISYTINNNGIPLVYNEGVSSVYKVFHSAQTSTVRCINALDNNLDVNFNFDFGTGFNADVFHVTKQSSGKYIVCGTFTMYGSVSVNRIVRLNTDGTLDTTFVPPAFNGIIRKVEIANSDTMYVMGDFVNVNGYSRVCRLDADGALILGFTPMTFNNSINDIHYSFVTGAITAVGSFTTVNGTGRNRICSFNSGGSLNSTSHGTGFNNVNFQPYTIVEQSSGKLIIGGDFTNYNGNTVGNIVRVTTALAYDATFVQAAGFAGGGGVYAVRSMYVDASDRIYCSGRFNTYKGNSRRGIIRLLIDGADDTANFAVGTGFGSNTQAFDIAETSDGTIVFVGDMGSYNGNSISKILEVTTGGTLAQSHTISFNAAIRTVFTAANTIIVGGGFTSVNNPNPPIQSQYNIPISISGVSATQTNAYNNLTAFNTHADIAYSTSGDTIYVTYTHDAPDVIIVDNILDIDGFVEITVVGSNLEAGATFILTQSPFFYSTTFSAGTIDTATIELRIYKGDFIDDEPVDPTYTINKSIVWDNQDTIYFNVSNYLREFCTTNIDAYMEDAAADIEPSSGDETTWIKLELESFYSGVTVSTKTEKFMGIDGFGWVEEGVNPNPGNVFITAPVCDILRYGHSRLYFCAKENESVEMRTSENPIFSAITYTAQTLNNDEYVLSHLITPNDTVDWIEYRFVYPDLEIIRRFNILDECFYNPVELIFKNKHGFLQSIPFQKRSNNSYKVDSKDYKKSILTQQATYNPRLHQTKNYLTNGEREITLNTGYVKDYFNITMKELIHSEEIYMNDGTTVIPVVLSDTTWNEKTNLNDQLVQYTIKVKLGQDTINKII